ncbi:cobaltochelatase subunit CobN [Prochlorococcus sp. MIT 1307]|uniref:cobaltochelatase subunit CobN n=1 Tax=Prochlorococcus sp. MIT 1307 TaxID=3096219 RepID=UPI002A749E4D|nr:cobaltochelatase subunit CobN [Prochlorococcus sp. MIT 1307]
MHRLATLPGDSSEQGITLVEQSSAPVLFLTSASTDIATLAATLLISRQKKWNGRIRALPLSALNHSAQIDHYINTSAKKANLILVRILGGRGHWSYGLEKLQSWVNKDLKRNLIIVSGTKEQEIELHSIGNIELKTTERISELLKIGGTKNMSTVLMLLNEILANRSYELDKFQVNNIDDPQKWDWRKESGPKVCILLYRALLQSGDVKLAKDINCSLRKYGFTPRLLWVSSLREENVKSTVCEILSNEKVKAILTTTSFSSVEFNDASSGAPLWDKLNIPIFQMLTSSINKGAWEKSKRGLSPLDLSMQIVLPELDGRITTRPCAFKTTKQAHKHLRTAIQSLESFPENLDWVSKHLRYWIKLQDLKPSEKQITLIIANYPVKNGRLANGVGLDTPASTLEILHWLKETGHYLGNKKLPVNSNELIKLLLNSRTNDPESSHKKPLDYLKIEVYLDWWDKLPLDSKIPILERWGDPKRAIDIESKGYPVHGIKYGNISLLIQPSRGYDSESLDDLHSPDLPPPHRYLAQYLWIKKVQKSNVVVHIGKHGSLEWLPGKGIGISSSCYPHIAIGNLPNIYPFIVNDPGEGSQAKRRSQAVIIDHLTPPLGLAGLHGDLLKLEGYMDEYYESRLLSEKRNSILEKKIIDLLYKNNWPLKKNINNFKELELGSISEIFTDVESYLCELKEAQIRTGLHILGKHQSKKEFIELLFLISKAPTLKRKGITQLLSKELGLDIDPWTEEPSKELTSNDKKRMREVSDLNFYNNGDLIEWLDSQALLIIEEILSSFKNGIFRENRDLEIAPKLKRILKDGFNPLKEYISKDLMPRLYRSPDDEKKSFINAISGRRVNSGPSGSPTRGREEVLPTGKNFYSVDLRGLPTEAAWELGKRSANNLLELHLMEKGEDLKKLAISVWGTATMRNGGEEISQLLSLIGIQPVWDGATRRVVDLEVIPLSILGRPRVDVFLRISGLFRDAFPQLIDYVNKAQRMIAALDEPTNMNPLSASIKQGKSGGRVYGSAPGSYGAGLQALIDSGAWENTYDLANAYLEWSQWRYENSDNAIKDIKGLKSCLSDVEVVLHNQDNREHDILDSDDYYQFHGGLTAAVEKTSKRKPDVLFGDNSRPQRPRVHKLSKEIDKVMRSRMLNPRWIKGMQKHGYKGAFEMGASLDYLFAYDASTGQVPNWCYTEICEKWLKEKNIKDFLNANNPWVLRDIAERLLEASNRNMWGNASIEQKEFLKNIVYKTEKYIEDGKYN